MDVFVHFIDQKQHGQIEFQMLVAEIGQPVEEIGVLSAEVDGYHIALVFDALGDESLGPGDVADDTVLLS